MNNKKQMRFTTFTFDWYKDRIFIETELFCPNCGVGGLMLEKDSHDYYTGLSYCCFYCYGVMQIPNLDFVDSEELRAKIKEFNEIKSTDGDN